MSSSPLTESQTVAVRKYAGLSPPGMPYWPFAKLLNGTLKLQRRLPGPR